MNQASILKTLAWLRIKFREKEHEVTLYNLFECAFDEHFHVLDEQAHVQIGKDIQAFEANGSIPAYLARFMRRLFAQYLMCRQPMKKNSVRVSAT
ncbi:MAG TPA: hypothetical protein VF803_00675 [Candidatus Paceibacterota bacterium]